MSKHNFGWAEVNITPDKKVSLAGQFAERISQYVEKLKKIRPKYVMLYAIDRATPEKKLEKLTVEEMEKFAQVIRNEGIEVKVYG